MISPHFKIIANAAIISTLYLHFQSLVGEEEGEGNAVVLCSINSAAPWHKINCFLISQLIYFVPIL